MHTAAAGRPEATSSQPHGGLSRPCGQLWLQLQWQSLAPPPLQGSLSLLCSTSEAGSGPRHPSIYSSHTLRASTALMRAPPGKGMGLHPPAPHPQESRAVTRAPGHHAPRPAGQDRAEPVKNAACAPLGAQLLSCAVTRTSTCDPWGRIMVTFPFTEQGTLVISICSFTAESPRILLLFQASSGRKAA